MKFQKSFGRTAPKDDGRRTYARLMASSMAPTGVRHGPCASGRSCDEASGQFHVGHTSSATFLERKGELGLCCRAYTSASAMNVYVLVYRASSTRTTYQLKVSY
jgi:hypothetical protein